MLRLLLPAYQHAAKRIEPSLAGWRLAHRHPDEDTMPLSQHRPLNARFPRVGRIGAGFLPRRKEMRVDEGNTDGKKCMSMKVTHLVWTRVCNTTQQCA